MVGGSRPSLLPAGRRSRGRHAGGAGPDAHADRCPDGSRQIHAAERSVEKPRGGRAAAPSGHTRATVTLTGRGSGWTFSLLQSFQRTFKLICPLPVHTVLCIYLYRYQVCASHCAARPPRSRSLSDTLHMSKGLRPWSSAHALKKKLANRLPASCHFTSCRKRTSAIWCA